MYIYIHLHIIYYFSVKISELILSDFSRRVLHPLTLQDAKLLPGFSSYLPTDHLNECPTNSGGSEQGAAQTGVTGC